jgi:hypothetical protein
MFPNANDGHSGVSERTCVPLVSGLIARDFAAPKRLAGLRFVSARFAPVPEAAVYENDEALPYEHEVRAA